MSVSERESGFTLIEMLVALAIFSLAALALLRLQGATAVNAGRLHEQAIAQIVARNLAVEAMTDPIAPAFGAAGGRIVNGGLGWRWARRTERSPEPRIQMISIHVRSELSSTAANMMVFRKAPQ